MKWLIGSIRSSIVSILFTTAFLCAVFAFLIMAGYDSTPRFLSGNESQIILIIVLLLVIAYIAVSKMRGRMSNLASFSGMVDPSVGPIDRENRPNRYAGIMFMWIFLAIVLAIAVILSFIYPL